MATVLDILLQDWRERLRSWSADGSLASAARLALELGTHDPPLLTDLVSQWAEGDFSALPPIVLLPASSMTGAAGAYAISTGTIYFNADWLATASQQQRLAVLTEELGHHLDGLLNEVDTPGDEGELFGALLLGNGVVSAKQRGQMLAEDDQVSFLVGGATVSVEQALVASTEIPASYPGHTWYEARNRYAFAALKADGSVITWGDTGWENPGGDSSAVVASISSGVTQIFSSACAFAALKTDGSVVTWGDPNYGGDSSAVAEMLTSGVTQIFSTDSAFAALKADGSVVTWGEGTNGIVASGIRSILSSTASAYAARRGDGSIVTFGDSSAGGDSTARLRCHPDFFNQWCLCRLKV